MTPRLTFQLRRHRVLEGRQYDPFRQEINTQPRREENDFQKPAKRRGEGPAGESAPAPAGRTTRQHYVGFRGRLHSEGRPWLQAIRLQRQRVHRLPDWVGAYDTGARSPRRSGRRAGVAGQRQHLLHHQRAGHRAGGGGVPRPPLRRESAFHHQRHRRDLPVPPGSAGLQQEGQDISSSRAGITAHTTTP